jgi:hypothetical protein
MATDFKRVDWLVDSLITAGLQSLGNDVKKRAVILAPYGATRTEGTHLRSTAKVHVSSTKDIVTVSFNKPYAKRRHYENNLHPATRLYLTNALKSIKDVGKYFKKF